MKYFWFQSLGAHSITIRNFNTAKLKTYYDILKLPQNCSYKDIRESYVKLSKQCHPDAKTASPNSEQFVKITEAYQILSKPHLRNKYDQDLLARNVMHNVRSVHMENDQVHRPWEIKPDYAANPGSYYGIKGINKVSNQRIVLILLALGVLGAMFGFVSANHSFEASKKWNEERIAQAVAHHTSVREDAKKYGNTEQVRRMVERLNKSPE